MMFLGFVCFGFFIFEIGLVYFKQSDLYNLVNSLMLKGNDLLFKYKFLYYFIFWK